MGHILLNTHINFEEKLFPLFEQAGVGFAKVGLDCSWQRVNRKLCEITGYSETELLSMTFCDITHPEDLLADLLNMEAVIAGELAINVMKKRYYHKNGSIVWIRLNATLVRNEHGDPDYFITIIEDITKKKHFEQSLIKSEERYRLVLQGSNDGIWDWDISTNQTYWNDRFCEIVGVQTSTPDPALGWNIIHPDDRPLVENAVNAHLQHGTKYELQFRFKRPSGESRHVLARAQAVWDKMGQPVRMAGVVTDITDRIQAEHALMESEERFRSMADSSAMMIWVMEPNGTVNYFNKKAVEFLGKPQAESVANHWQDILHPEDQAAARDQWLHAIQHRQFLQMECRIRQANGHYRWVLTNNAPRFSPEGEFLGFVGSAVDITENKLAQDELKTYALKLEKSNQELEQFATIASHDLQAPLRKIMMFSDALKMNAGSNLSPECHTHIGRIQKAALKMQNLITDLLALSRVSRNGKPFHLTSLKEAVQEALNTLEFILIETGGTVEIGDMVELEADPMQLQQLMQNLIENALKFHRNDCPPIVHIQSRHLTNGFCEIIVSDNGIGFDERFVERIFRVFERLHGSEHYGGTGIGLAICHKIVERHAGTITAQSAPDQGSQFIITLPVRQA